MNEGLMGFILFISVIAFCLWLGSGTQYKSSIPDDIGYCDARSGCW